MWTAGPYHSWLNPTWLLEGHPWAMHAIKNSQQQLMASLYVDTCLHFHFQYIVLCGNTIHHQKLCCENAVAKSAIMEAPERSLPKQASLLDCSNHSRSFHIILLTYITYNYMKACVLTLKCKNVYRRLFHFLKSTCHLLSPAAVHFIIMKFHV